MNGEKLLLLLSLCEKYEVPLELSFDNGVRFPVGFDRQINVGAGWKITVDNITVTVDDKEITYPDVDQAVEAGLKILSMVTTE